MSVNIVNINRPQKYSMMTDDKHKKHHHESPSSNVKRTAAVSSLLGMGTALALISKKQGFSLSPKVIKNTPVKDWALFKIPRIRKFADRTAKKPLDIEEKEILTLATGSVAGGLIGGAISDKENMRAKGREALTQLVGNVLTPVLCVGGIARLYGKYENKIKSIMPTVKTIKDGKAVKNLKTLNKLSRSIPAVVLTGTALAIGISAGSKVTNFINTKVFGQKKHRDIKASDFAPHVDDLCLAITLMGSKNSAVASSITRTVPFFLSVPGYQVGKAQEKA